MVSDRYLPQSGKCWNGTFGVTGALHGPVAGHVGVGVSGGPSVGFSYGGSLLDSRLFLHTQAAAMLGGIYGGVGFSVQGGAEAVGFGISSPESWHAEVRAGFGGGGSLGADVARDAQVSGGGGYHGRLPLGRIGVGIGFAAGGGAATTSTIGYPSRREVLNWLSKKAGVDRPGSGVAATCQ
jgi:hypothetical protein